MERNILTILHRGEAPFTTLDAVPSTSLDNEQLDLTRLARFAMWNSSTWALDCISRRLTQREYDWNGLRDALIRSDVDREDLARRLSVDDLFILWDALGSGRDPEAESALLGAITSAHGRGESIDFGRASRLVAGLLMFDRVNEARTLTTMLEPGSWSRVVAEMELNHPRFGGSYEASLASLNDVYREVGLATVALAEGSGTPFSRLDSLPRHSVRGPLVTIVMSAWRPGDEIFTAVRSVVSQTYRDWELIVTDDASGDDFDHVFAAIAALDERIRIVRNVDNSGTYVRRNEILRDAIGEFVTFHDSDDWSHAERIETQVRDLLNHPDRVGNVVRHVRATDELSFATNRGMSLTMTEPSIMFRRATALEAAGFYDSLRKGADREYRLRLEAVTGSVVETVGPAAPLQVMLASTTSLSGSDFAPGWMIPARVAYRNASDRYHSRVREGRASGRLDFPQRRRSIVAPAAFLGDAEIPVISDILVIADLREAPGRARFLTTLESDIRRATQEGLSVAVLHTDSVGGRFGGPRLSDKIQELVDEATVHQVLDDTPVQAGLVVVRHAVAAQGHRAERRPIETDRVVIVQDPAGGDRPGETFSHSQVGAVVDEWFGAMSEWVSAESITSIQTADASGERGIAVLAANSSPSSRLRYEHQVVAFEADDVTIRFRRVGGSLGEVDVVFGVDAMDALLSLKSGATSRERLKQTRKFVDELTAKGAGLIRTVVGEAAVTTDAHEREARELLDTVTSRFIVIDDVTATPDPLRTVRIPFADPTPLFVGFPVSEQVTGRLLCLTGGGSNAAIIGALRTAFMTRIEGLSVRVVGVDDASLEGEVERASRRPSVPVTTRIEILSDAALLEEITAAEFVLLPELRSLADYQIAMIALAFERPVLTPANAAARALSIDVGAEWVVSLEGTMSAERLDQAIIRARGRSEKSRPRLDDRDWWRVGQRYEQIFRNVVREQRERRLIASRARSAEVARLDDAST